MPDKRNNTDPINLDLINMVQNARMAHDDTAQPSQVPGVYWVEAKNQQAAARQPTPRTGEWRIPTSVTAIDALWAQIKQATEAGKLGYKAKASTKPAHGQAGRDERVICVRTYDADDSADVRRVQAALREMGIEDMTYTRDKEG